MAEQDGYFDTQRMISVTDGVVAISLTLLALTLSIPVVKEIQGSEGLAREAGAVA